MPIPDSSALPAFVSPAVLALIGLALKGTILLAAGMLAARALRSVSASARHLAWSVTFGCLLALPALSAVVPRWELGLLPPAPSVSSGLTIVEPEPPASQLVAAASSESAPASSEDGLPAPTTAVLLLWAAGFLSVAVYFGLGSWRLHGIAARAERVTSGEWLVAASRARRRLHLDRRIILLRSRESQVPMTWGALRPAVLLPAAADEWDAALRRDVLMHELAHVRRNDYLVQLAVRAACALYWFHPLVWIAAARLRREQERACDDRVLQAGSTPSEYAAHLLEVARAMRTRTLGAPASVALARHPGFAGRVAAVLDATRPHGSLGPGTAVPALLLGGLLLTPLASISPWAPASAEECSVDAVPAITEPPARVVRASFAPGDIVEAFHREASYRLLPKAIGNETPVLTAPRGWCPVRFAEPTGEKSRSGRLSTDVIEKRPVPALPASVDVDLASRLGAASERTAGGERRAAADRR